MKDHTALIIMGLFAFVITANELPEDSTGRLLGIAVGGVLILVVLIIGNIYHRSPPPD